MIINSKWRINYLLARGKNCKLLAQKKKRQTNTIGRMPLNRYFIRPEADKRIARRRRQRHLSRGSCLLWGCRKRQPMRERELRESKCKSELPELLARRMIYFSLSSFFSPSRSFSLSTSSSGGGSGGGRSQRGWPTLASLADQMIDCWPLTPMRALPGCRCLVRLSIFSRAALTCRAGCGMNSRCR